MMCTSDCLVSVFQYIALLAAILTWIAYRVAHPIKENPIFRIEKLRFDDGTEAFYCSRRWPLNRWKSFEIEEGIKGYATMEDAEQAMTSYLKNRLGLEMTETTVEKEYG